VEAIFHGLYIASLSIGMIDRAWSNEAVSATHATVVGLSADMPVKLSVDKASSEGVFCVQKM
jgi:hypothetical protein